MEFASDADLLETFKAAALSVTKLYKTSAAVANKSRAEGYQECLDDLISFLDRKSFSSSEATAIRHWAAERLPQNDTNDTIPSADSDDDNTPSSPAVHADPPEPLPAASQSLDAKAGLAVSSSAPAPTTNFREPVAITVPSRDVFNFQSPVPYPPHSADMYPNLASLDLSESSAQTQQHQTTSQRKARIRADRSRILGRSAANMRNVAGSKRKLNLDELFDLGSIGKDGLPFGKRSRHT